MATIQSTLSFQDQMSATLNKITMNLDNASIATEKAKQNMEDMAYAYGAGSKEAMAATVAYANQKNKLDSLTVALNTAKKQQEELNRAEREAQLKQTFQEQKKAEILARIEANRNLTSGFKQLSKVEQQVAEREKQLAIEAQMAKDKIKIFGFEIQNTKNETDKLSSGFRNAVNNLSIFGISIGTIIGNFATRAIDSLRQSIGTAIETASDLAEVQNVVDVAFDSNADTINKWANTTLNAYGLNELSAKKYAGTMGAMLKSSGLTGDAVAEMAMKITELSGDMASFYNLSSEESFSKIRAGISGETEPLKQLGINMSVANLEAYALSKGMQVSYKSMSQAAQMTLRYQYLLETTKDAQGDFTRTQGSFANQQKLAQENWLRLSSIIANMFIPALTDGYKIMNTVMNFLSNNIMTILPLLITTLGVVTIAFVAMKIEAIQAGLASVQAALSASAAWIAATAPLWVIIGVIGVVSVALNKMGINFRQQAENILTSFNWIITAIQNVIMGIQNIGIAWRKVWAWITRSGEQFEFKSFKANDLYTNQARAQRQMSSLSVSGGALTNKALLGTRGTGATGELGGLDGLTTNTSGGKALKTQNQGDIGIKEEDMELLHDLATRDFMLNYQQLTPQITIPGMVIHETADVNQIFDAMASSVSELVDTSLSVSEGSLAV